MATIPIQRTERTVWPWLLLGAVLFGLLAWWLLGARTPDRRAVAAAPTVSAAAGPGTAVAGGEVTAMPTAIERLARFADAGRGTMAPSHNYTADGLRHVADALEAVRDRAPADIDVEARVREIRARADALQRDPTSTAHALQAREAFVLATSTLRQMRPAAGGTAANSDPIVRAHDAALAIEPRTRLLEQRTRVEQFFASTADALRQIAG